MLKAAPLALVFLPVVAFAQSAPRTLEFDFTPTARTQIALWVEGADGSFLSTIRLTQAVSVHGIGNRPGATEMNSGFRWPYGRREGALPIWAHRRATGRGAAKFKRVIFQDRQSEGFASRTSNDSTPESYFCLSFAAETTKQAALDAVTCASAFSSDKGRYVTDADITGGYSEPAEVGGHGLMRALDLFSLYPPRRDATGCSAGPCSDTDDVKTYNAHAREVMPDIDAVTMATPPPESDQSILFTVPESWPDGEYAAFVEVSLEGDHNDAFNDDRFGIPKTPEGAWDSWAMSFGYPYRGQPSVVFKVGFTLGPSGAFSTAVPAGYGDVDGFGATGGDLHPLDGSIANDPIGHPGSGADRLRLVSPRDYRFRVAARGRNECERAASPGAPTGMMATPVANAKHSHQWATLQFVVPTTDRPIAHYDVRFSKSLISAADSATFERALPAMAAKIDSEGLMVPTDAGPGTAVGVDLGGLDPMTRYWVAVRAVDACNVAGPYAVTELTTTKVTFTQLSGCFVATAAYGSAMEPEVQALRDARDALRTRNGVFAVATDLYYRSGPAAAAVIARSEAVKAIVRSVLAPIVDLAKSARPLTSR